MPLDLAHDVRDPQEILLRAFEFFFGEKLSALVLARAGCFFDQAAPFFRLGVDQFIDFALLHNRIGFAADAGA